MDTTSVRRPRDAEATAIAAAHVVLPTPPLPPTSSTRGICRYVSGEIRRLDLSVLVAVERGLDADDLVVAGRERGPFAASLPLADLAQPGQDVRFELVELCLAHLAELDPHLGCEQLLAERRVVVQLGIDGWAASLSSTKRRPPTSLESMMNTFHCARSSFSLMLTKL
jgi:hypothetical protein